MALPQKIKIVEVGPRDGLQDEVSTVPVSVRVELIERLIAAGIGTVEAGSMVSPQWVPQMADSDQVLQTLLASHPDPLQFPVLVPNQKGLEDAIRVGARHIAVFASSTEAFSQKNINCSIAESLKRYQAVIKSALAQGLKVRGYVSCVMGCPYEGDVAPAQVVKVAKQLYDFGCYEISLGDTIGMGTPGKTEQLLDALLTEISSQHLAVHFHDTYGQALVNIYVALNKGISVIDSAVAGLGGCPYAPSASGNVATEEVLYMLEGLGIKTGIDLCKVAQAGQFICDYLGKPTQSKVGLFCLRRDRTH